MKIKQSILRIYAFIKPPPEWHVPVLLFTAMLGGLFLNILRISNAISYLSDKPETCMNCHVMSTQYATWERSMHGKFTTCNDCHVPQNNILSKYLFKANDGLRHSAYFTFRLEPDVIRIKHDGIAAVQENCQRCHENTLARINTKEENCWRCHRDTPHGTVNSLAAAPYARVPRLENPVPDWLEKLIQVENKK